MKQFAHSLNRRLLYLGHPGDGIGRIFLCFPAWAIRFGNIIYYYKDRKVNATRLFSYHLLHPKSANYAQ